MRPLREMSSDVITSTATGESTFVRGVREPTASTVCVMTGAVASAKSSFAYAPAATLTTRSSLRNPEKSARTWRTPGAASSV